MHSMDPNLRLNLAASRWFRPLLVVGLLCIGASAAIGCFGSNPGDFWRSYLTAFVFVVSIALGALFFTLVQHLTRAGWSVVLRRIAESVAANLTWIWILFLPLAALMLSGKGDLLFCWVGGSADDHLLQHKAPYLNVPFWLGRSIFYLALWALLSAFYFKSSVAQDDTGDVNLTHRMQRWAPLAMILFALTQSFASVDWIKSIDPTWFSTMFGVYFFAAGTTGFFATLCIAMWLLQRAGIARNEITVEHYHDAGKFLFAFGVVFWAYIAFSQYMLIWYANIPEETTWYLVRQIGGWGSVSVVLLVGHFIIPFLALISRHPKRMKGLLAIMAVWMLLFHYVDMVWLVQPGLRTGSIEGMTLYSELTAAVADGSVDVGFRPRPVDLACLIGLSCLFAAMTLRRLGQCCAIPVGDPRLAESLAFENM
jgi:hypothetical protein